ncbi:MAG: mandelate racemase/muconate lactonizing enzyme family protein [Pirellulales bacterium]|nr:mandelate racemase/muconate lactonizing enzyme family protein [Pirellulales bacterium]
MTKATDIRIVDVQTSVNRTDYRTPMKFGGRVVVDVTLFNVDVTVETSDGKQATGHGSMPVGNAWGWPSQVVDGTQTLEAMIKLGDAVADSLAGSGLMGHAVEIMHELSKGYDELAAEVTSELQLAESMPRLAQLVSASPIDAAVHDAYGKVHNENIYNLLGSEFVNHDLAHYLNSDFDGRFLNEFTLRTPKASMPLYHLVGALDPLTDGDIETRLNDGIPETLGEWINADGLTNLKIKLAGDDLQWDVDRVAAIDRVSAETQSARGCNSWVYSLDFNEKCANVQYLIDFMAKLEEVAPDALGRVQYIEQPTNRDLKSNPENRMHEAAKIKPVVIDESLVDFESLLLAREQGYSGVALKTCKGHGEAMIMGAAAIHYGLFLCVQDLTCIGFSFLHSASLAARIPTIAAIEGNGRQYCPAGNEAWVPQYPGMFEIHDGSVGTSALTGPGIGI